MYDKINSTAQHSTAQHSTAQHSTAQHSTAQHSTAQHSTAQHSTAQHSTAQHSTAQHRLRFLPQMCKSYTKLLFALIVVVGITACGGGGGGGGGAAATTAPPVAATTAPLPPTSLSAVASTNQITIDWIGSTGAGYYEIYRSTSSFIAPSSLPIESPLVANGTSYTDAIGLTANTQYYYWIKACKNGTICSEYSAKKSVKTFSFTTINDTGITFSGNYPTGNNSDCSGTNIIAQQDCANGRDTGKPNTVNYGNGKVGGGMAGFDFTKLGQNGNDLTIQNATWDDNSGSETAGTRWSCVRDNHTGLIWEVKNNDGNTPTGTNPTVSSDNIHHKDNRYRWGGLTADGNDDGFYHSDWTSLVTDTNGENLCGFSSGWRVPGPEELINIVNRDTDLRPTIDKNYFPNTVSDSFWSSSPYAIGGSGDIDTYAWRVNFIYGSSVKDAYRNEKSRVRLVRGGQ